MFTGREMLSANEVLITNRQGVIADIVNEPDAGDDIEYLEGILTPGFINCHCHLELSHMKGVIAPGSGLVDFILKVVSERHVTEELIIAAIDEAEMEMLRNGIVAVGDICNNAITVPQKIKGNLTYHNFIEATGFIPAVAGKRFQLMLDVFGEFEKWLPANSITPHAPYSVSPPLFKLLNESGANRLLSIHNQEIADENALFENGTGGLLSMYGMMGIDISFFRPTGQSALQSWLPHFNREQTLILVHNVATSARDVEFAGKHASGSGIQLYYCLCPNANLYISKALPQLTLFSDLHEQMVLGTDSLASNQQLSILSEMNTLLKFFPALKQESLLMWATSNGAKALEIDNKFGSFEKGKQPGIVLIDDSFEKASRLL